MDKRRVLGLCLGLTIALQAGAQGPGLAAKAAGGEGGTTERGRLVYKIVKKWGPHVQELYKVPMDQWANGMASTFANAPIAKLQEASNTDNFNVVNSALLPAPKGVSPKALGDIAQDLVYVPISPCRIFDTRVAGGAIAANTVRGIDVSAVSDYSFQGGAASNCSGMGSAGSFAAVAINFTSVQPAQTGYFTAYPFGGTQPLAATQVYAAGDIRSNLAVVQLDQGASANEMNIYSEKQLHLVGDVVGYYINPQATPLECQDTAAVVVSVAAGATANAASTACPAGYTQTATNCESSTWQMPFVFFKGGTCSAQNNSAGAASLRASRTCCRVPGR